MEHLVQIVIHLLPVLVVAGVMLYIFHEGMRFIERRRSGRPTDHNTVVSTEAPTVLAYQLVQLQLQAAERFVLYLERIAPDRLVMRLHQNGMNSKMLQSEMLRAIREEYDHNLPQQIYLSEKVWELIGNAKEEMVTFISKMGDSMPANASGLDLSRKIFEAASRVENLPTDIALRQLRKETRKMLRVE